MKAPLLSGCPSSNSELGQIRVHVLYKRAEIPAKTVIPAIALSVTYREQESPANTGSTPVSATKLLKIIHLQKWRTGLPLSRVRHRQGQRAIPDGIPAACLQLSGIGPLGSIVMAGVTILHKGLP